MKITYRFENILSKIDNADLDGSWSI